MTFQVEDGYAIPAARQPSSRRPKYPWTKLEVGQSFFVEGEPIHSLE